MKRLLLLFTALPLLVTACFNHTASLAVNKEGLRAIANNLQSTGAPQFTQTNAPYGEVLEPPQPENPTAGASNMKLKISLTGDVTRTREFDIFSSPYAGGSYEIDNLPVGAEVDVDVSLWQGDTKEYGTEFPKSVRLETGTNEVTVELAQALQKTSINAMYHGETLPNDPNDQPITVGEEVTFTYYGTRNENAAVHIISVSPAGGTITGNGTSSPTLTFGAAGTYTVTAYAAAAGYAPSASQTWTINVEDFQPPEPQPKTYTLSVTSLGTVITGDTVTFPSEASRPTITVSVLGDGAAYLGSVTWSFSLDGDTTQRTGAAPTIYTFDDNIVEADGKPHTLVITAQIDGQTVAEKTLTVTKLEPLQLAGTITHLPEKTDLTVGDQVTFSYTGDDSSYAGNTTVSLTFRSGTNMTSISGGDRLGAWIITGTNGSVTLSFTKAGTYTITDAHAELQGYGNSDPVTFTFTVTNPQLSGGVFPNNGNNTLDWGTEVAFNYNDPLTKSEATIHLTVSPRAGVTAASGTSGGKTLEVGSDGTVTGEKGQEVVLTFKPDAQTTYNISNAYATADGYEQSKTSQTVAYTVKENIKLILITGSRVTAVPTGEDADGPFASAGTTPVTVAPFRIAETELTYAKWYEVYQWATTQAPNRYTFANPGQEGSGGTTGAPPTTGSTQPVTKVSWRDAVVWCNAASEKDGFTPVYVNGSYVPVRNSTTSDADNATVLTSESGYRLPTEEEWEFAARGGKPDDTTNWNYIYAGTSDQNQLGNYAVYGGSSAGVISTANVGSKTANSAQLYDMSGNVWEYCWDKLSDSSSERVHRGGGWDVPATGCTVANRSKYQPNDSHFNLGFRVVRIGTGN